MISCGIVGANKKRRKKRKLIEAQLADLEVEDCVAEVIYWALGGGGNPWQGKDDNRAIAFFTLKKKMMRQKSAADSSNWPTQLLSGPSGATITYIIAS